MADDYSSNTFIDYVAPEFATKQRIDQLSATIENLQTEIAQLKTACTNFRRCLIINSLLKKSPLM